MKQAKKYILGANAQIYIIRLTLFYAKATHEDIDMKKKQFALGSLLLGAASWLCLWGLQHIERRMKKKQKK